MPDQDARLPASCSRFYLNQQEIIMAAAIVEFYIACNPPLLPQGVSEVVRRVQDTEGLIEILYEPHVPWLKCITLSQYRTTVTTAVQDNLFAIADEDVDALDPEADEPSSPHVDADVSIISPDPRMMPWAEYRRRSHTFADAAVYPEPIAEASHKTAWRGLEDLHSVVTFAALLAHAGQSVERFEAETGCQISYNARQTVVYLGLQESQERLDMAVERLNSMTKQYIEDKNRAPPQLLPPLPVLSAAVVAANEAGHDPYSAHDPFDDIPPDVNARLPDSAAWMDPFKNNESLL